MVIANSLLPTQHIQSPQSLILSYMCLKQNYLPDHNKYKVSKALKRVNLPSHTTRSLATLHF